MRKPHKPMPDLAVVNELFDYDPATGGLYKKHAEPCEANCIGSFTKSGHKQVHVKGHGIYLVHRLVYFMFYREDPGKYYIDHKNCDRADNRIENLRRVKPSLNARNVKSKLIYEVDDKGVGRWVTSCS